MFIKFTETRITVEDLPQIFKAGRVYELPAESCERWKRRQVAEDATEAEFAAQAKADKAAPKKAAPKKAAHKPAADTPDGDEQAADGTGVQTPAPG